MKRWKLWLPLLTILGLLAWKPMSGYDIKKLIAAVVDDVAGGDLAAGKIDVKVQDAYSMRSSPQVIGAAHDSVGSPPADQMIVARRTLGYSRE